MDIGFGPGLTPPAPAGETPTGVANRIGAVTAGQEFGEQVRQLLGRWSLEAGDAVPAGIAVARSGRAPTPAPASRADASASADPEAPEVGDDTDAPTVASAFVDPAAWLRPALTLSAPPEPPPARFAADIAGSARQDGVAYAPIERLAIEGRWTVGRAATTPARDVERAIGQDADGRAAARQERLPEAIVHAEPANLPDPPPAWATTDPPPRPAVPPLTPRPQITAPPEPSDGATPKPGSGHADTRTLRGDHMTAPTAAPVVPRQGEVTPPAAPVIAEAAPPVFPQPVPVAAVAEAPPVRGEGGRATPTSGRRATSRAAEPDPPVMATPPPADTAIASGASHAPAASLEGSPLDAPPGTHATKPRATPTLAGTFGTAYVDMPEPTTPRGPTVARPDATAAHPMRSEEPALEHQIVESLRLHATAGGGEARVRLRPEYLGEVTITVVVEDGIVSARLEASVPAVREWAERHEASLRQALGEHGLTLDTLSVHDQPTADDAHGSLDRDPDRDPEPRQRPRPPRRRHDTDGPRFEVEV